MRPTIGITCDTTLPAGESAARHMSPRGYAEAVWRAGGNPVLLPHVIEAIDEQLRCCAGIVLSGGDDPDMTMFDQPNHPAATIMDINRQRYELALIAALDHTHHPVLGICLGMQLMCLHHGGTLVQHMNPSQLAVHQHADHAIGRCVDGPHMLTERATVHSHHHQAIGDAGAMRVCARANDGVIEAVDRADSNRFYLGVQWHPERTTDPKTGISIFHALIAATGK